VAVTHRPTQEVSSLGVDFSDGKKTYPQHTDTPRRRKDRHFCPRPSKLFGLVNPGARVMNCDVSTHWRARAEQMRALAEEMRGGISRYLMHRIADDYERFARTVEHRPSRFLPIPPVVPAEARRFAPRKNSFGAPRIIDLELPSFLKRGPATADELGASI